jgi:crotonobetainyl-CoA:carnitine CoA-transferase CaiB-like acyl-CoA transferase
VPLADLAGGLQAAFAVCAALIGRARTGEGERVDVSMADVLVSWAGPEPGGSLAASDDPLRRFPAYGSFACADGYVTLGVVTEDGWWRELCTVLGLDDLADLDAEARAQDGDALRHRVAAAIGEGRRDDLVDELLARRVPVAPLLSHAEAVAHDHFRARGTTASTPDGLERFGHPTHHLRHPARVSDRAGPVILEADAGFGDVPPRS